jgi:uncharacterized glyoxalase superfamily protein PhnB
MSNVWHNKHRAGGLSYILSVQSHFTGREGSAMNISAEPAHATIVPCLKYRDAVAAIEWLCTTFGFSKHAVHMNDDGTVAHAQLTFGNGMIMLSSVDGVASDWGQLIKQPNEVGGTVTQSAYLIVANADTLYASAKAGGAKIAVDIKDEDYGGRGFGCYDLEGHLWSFGTYNPW